MTAIAKSAKRHPAAKKCCGWEEPAIWKLLLSFCVLGGGVVEWDGLQMYFHGKPYYS